jgi:hypothetical protein
VELDLAQLTPLWSRSTALAMLLAEPIQPPPSDGGHRSWFAGSLVERRWKAEGCQKIPFADRALPFA